jgi:two-component system chemotaxis response regulator CheY
MYIFYKFTGREAEKNVSPERGIEFMYRVMIVEDNTLMRKSIAKILSQHSYDIVVEVTNGEDALLRYQIARPDVVIMDINLPKKTGMEAIKEIINFDPMAKIVVCTVMDQQARIVEAVRNGARGYIVKPFKPKDLLDSIKNVLSQ